MKTQKKWNVRLAELILQNKSNEEIKNIIYREYSIIIKLEDIEKKRITSEKIFNDSNNLIEEKKELIVNTLTKLGSMPLTSRQISDLIYFEKKIKIDKSEVSSILWSQLKNEVEYNRKEFTFILKSNSKLIADFKIKNVELEKLFKIINEEKLRIGSPDATLLAENIKFRLMLEK